MQSYIALYLKYYVVHGKLGGFLVLIVITRTTVISEIIYVGCHTHFHYKLAVSIS